MAQVGLWGPETKNVAVCIYYRKRWKRRAKSHLPPVLCGFTANQRIPNVRLQLKSGSLLRPDDMGALSTRRRQ